MCVDVSVNFKYDYTLPLISILELVVCTFHELDYTLTFNLYTQAPQSTHLKKTRSLRVMRCGFLCVVVSTFG